VAVLVALDPLGRQIYRQEGSLGYKRRGYSGPGDSLSWTVSSPTQIQRQVPLPGGVVLTAETGLPNKWSVPNMHGDIAWVTDQTGTVTSGPNRYDPYGKPLGTRVGVNVIEAADYGWLGSHQRLNEEASGLTWMGARIYQPTTGRFLSADPVEAGTPNDYTYPADPVNQYDIDGRYCVFGTHGGKGGGCRGGSVKQSRHKVINIAVSLGAGLGVAACIASVACGIAAGVGIVGSAAVAGLAAHKASDAILDDNANDISVIEAARGSTVAAIKGGATSVLCVTAFGSGCLVAAKTAGGSAVFVYGGITIFTIMVEGTVYVFVGEGD
jgi:RHS repeat-associated protein